MKEWRKSSDFEVSPYTCALIAVEQDGYIVSLVIEDGEKFYVDSPPIKLMDQACKFFGSSLRGRIDGTKEVSGITHKPPIAVDPVNGMYFFPTISPQKKNCSWIAHSHIDHIRKCKGDSNTTIVFKDKYSIEVSVSKGSIWNQVQRTAQFRYKLDERLQTIPKQISREQVAESFLSVHS
ncbi:competence protein ComK [Pontibacillus litoralis]|uniref:Competence protein n=1 Tax=Pontibacillus litoralis JSM 072002 TaxID=1385512 RepID=A0A0A5G114_9BACI|nr:competence protein ComK [Pontibacillus litoralis]KGX84798.1 competence protein [Pontibacillus litoralis JSM 072002]